MFALAERPREIRRLKVIFYSHDTVGLGHIRRNIAVASTMAPSADVVMITGNPEAAALPLPSHTDIVTVPTVAKDAAGRYRSRTLGAPLRQVIEIRAALIAATVQAFEPDLVVVDKVPLGLAGELLPTLRWLRRPGSRAKVVLGLREVLDDPRGTTAEWEAAESTQAIRESYDAVWVYGDRSVYDPVTEYALPPEVAAKIIFTGYLAAGRSERLARRTEAGTQLRPTPPDRPYVLCTVGGGQDGSAVAMAFAKTRFPAGRLGVVISGPFMPPAQRAALHRAAARRTDLVVHDFVADTERFLTGCDAVITMGGYNSVCEVLGTNRPALVVPRCRPRTEQLIRADRLAARGAIDTLGRTTPTPSTLGGWLASAADSAARTATARAGLQLDGLQRIPDLVDALILRPIRREVGHAA
jgi:predicted glycosyltransferase